LKVEVDLVETLESTVDYNHIKSWLLPKLDEKQMSVEQFANEIGVTRAMVYFYMNDKNRPSEQVMIKMCQVLEVPPEEGMRQYTPRKPGRPKGAS
jgi:transcriptional regulator with XRE-family HTH domain